MKTPVNHFKAALKSGQHQLGIWNSIDGRSAVELLANAGYDWVLLDTEHSPVDVNDVLPALQTVAGYPETSAVVRPAANDTVLIKRMLDLGAQTLLIPYVQDKAEAEAAVRAMHYAPRGIRGVAGLTRASRFGKVEDYLGNAASELCLLLQVETREALERIDEIATVEGVDGIFIGPADLAASMGHGGNTGHPEVVAAIEGAIDRLKELGVPAGILTLDRDFARACIRRGTAFTAVGVDLALLNDAVLDLLTDFRAKG